MKRVTALILSALMLTSLVGCGNDAEKDEFLKYYNEDMPAVFELDQQVYDSFTSIQEPTTKEELDALLATLAEETIPLANSHYNAAFALAAEIKNEDLLEVHKIYVDYASKMETALTALMMGMTSLDMDSVAKSQEAENERNQLYLDYSRSVDALAKKYGLEGVSDE